MTTRNIRKLKRWITDGRTHDKKGKLFSEKYGVKHNGNEGSFAKAENQLKHRGVK